MNHTINEINETNAFNHIINENNQNLLEITYKIVFYTPIASIVALHKYFIISNL